MRTLAEILFWTLVVIVPGPGVIVLAVLVAREVKHVLAERRRARGDGAAVHPYAMPLPRAA